jgi:SAM-dependent methyltransferase
MWDQETARRYDAWFQTPTGLFALKREIRLLEHMTADWPRRGQRLLEIGCGTGVFLEVLHRAGFDVTGLDAAPAMLEAARVRLGQAADLHLGQAEHLPFADKEFDFSVLLTVLEFCVDPGLALREAVRVTRKAVLIGFLNSFSLYWLTTFGLSRCGGDALRRAHWFSPWEVRRLIRDNLGRHPGHLLSILPGPRVTWRESLPWRLLNSPMLSFPVGSICARTISLTNEPVMTLLPSFSKAKACIG